MALHKQLQYNAGSSNHYKVKIQFSNCKQLNKRPISKVGISIGMQLGFCDEEGSGIAVVRNGEMIRMWMLDAWDGETQVGILRIVTNVLVTCTHAKKSVTLGKNFR